MFLRQFILTEVVNQWFVGFEKNGGMEDKVEILSLDDQGNGGVIDKNMEIRKKGGLQEGGR